MIRTSRMLLLTIICLSLLSRDAAMDVSLTSITIFQTHEMDFFFIVNPPEVYLHCEDSRDDVQLEEVDEVGRAYTYEVGEVIATTLDASGDCVSCELRESDAPFGDDIYGSFDLCLDQFEDTGTHSEATFGQFSATFQCPDCVPQPATPPESTPAVAAVTPSEPAVVPGTPLEPAVVPETPLEPAVVPETPLEPAVVPETPIEPAVVPETPLVPAPTQPPPPPAAETETPAAPAPTQPPPPPAAETETPAAPAPTQPPPPPPPPVATTETPAAPAPVTLPNSPDKKSENQLDKEILPGPLVKPLLKKPTGDDASAKTGMFSVRKAFKFADKEESSKDSEWTRDRLVKEIIVT